MSYEAPFAGLRVVDLSQGIAGPYAGMLLALYGADVVKVEPPEGDWARTVGTRYGDQTAFSVAANLGKRSIALDLKTPEGQEIVRRLVARGDVLLEDSVRRGREAGRGLRRSRPSIHASSTTRCPAFARRDRTGTVPPSTRFSNPSRA